jgi:hypothetical protein
VRKAEEAAPGGLRKMQKKSNTSKRGSEKSSTEDEEQAPRKACSKGGRKRFALLMDVQVKLRKEECALSMGQRSRPNDAA